MAKAPKKKIKNSLPKSSNFYFITGVVSLGVLALLVFKTSANQSVLGDATRSAGLKTTQTPHQVVLTCGQCVAQQTSTNKHTPVGLCMHISGKDSYAKCQYGGVSPTGTTTQNGNVCVVCNPQQLTITPHPTKNLSQTQTRSVTRAPKLTQAQER